jgi:hypothetical protein
MTATPHNVGLHPEDCFGCKAASISMSPSAMPTRSNAGVINMDTKAMHADVAAYKRLRKDGTQPKSVKGAAALESRAVSKWEIETGTTLKGDSKLGKRLDETQGAINRGESVL